ncbi:hypothetical protein RRG08_041482 [Elysia crispata]|uniref:Uncharacterized protein n=1 Tax=Elysia crispata TaxID=231223 RepID=A0AAE1CRG9_9GAST|nr:hypothetical protein RRG08_041482 [Elysia crispata]
MNSSGFSRQCLVKGLLKQTSGQRTTLRKYLRARAPLGLSLQDITSVGPHQTNFRPSLSSDAIRKKASVIFPGPSCLCVSLFESQLFPIKIDLH